MITVILSIINEALPLLDKLVPDQSTKIKNELLSLREEWDNEISKGVERDDCALDNFELRISDLCELFSSALKQASSKN